MSKYYYVEVKLKENKWTLITTYTKQADAMHHVKDEINEGIKYPMRVVKVERTIVFDGSKV